MRPIDFCPASAAADKLARIEACSTLVDRVLVRSRHDQKDGEGQVARELEAIQLKLSLQADAARTRLAEAEAISPAGAIAQLLGAIRDMRVGDDAERERARRLEAGAMRYLAASNLLGVTDARRISRTTMSVIEMDYPASRAISSSEMS